MKESRPRCWVVLVGAGGGDHLTDSLVQHLGGPCLAARLVRPGTASEPFAGQTNSVPNLGIYRAWEPRSCSMYSVSSHCHCCRMGAD